MKNNIPWDVIDQYIAGELEGEALQIFNRRLDTDLDFAEVVMRQRVLRSMVIDKDKLAFQRTIEAVEATLPTPRAHWNRWLFAALIFGILVFAYRLIFPDTAETPKIPIGPIAQQVEKWSLESPDVSLISMSNEINDLTTAQELFKKGDYAAAASIFQNYLGQNPRQYSVWLYLGFARMQLGQYAESAAAFNTIIEADGLDSYLAYWYQALTYFRQGELDLCQTTLDTLLALPYIPNPRLEENARLLRKSLER